MAFVLDATAIRSGMTIAGEGWFTTPSVINEIRLGRQGKDMALLADLSITVKSPSDDYVDRVRSAAEKTGDINRLSGTDIDILALALELDGTLITDDYSVQNIASILKLQYKTALTGIREIIHWTYRCRGCGKFFEKEQTDCPVCGSEIGMVKKR